MFWGIIVPLSATIIFSSCANNRQTKHVDGEDKMAYRELTVKNEAEAKDTLKLTPTRTSGREFLLKARLQELKDQLNQPPFKLPLAQRGGERLTPEQIAFITKEVRFITLEGHLYSSALKGDVGEITRCKRELLEVGEKTGEKKRALDIILNFEKINNMK